MHLSPSTFTKLSHLLVCLSVSITASSGWLFTQHAQAVDLLQQDFDGVALEPIVTFFTELRDREAWTDDLPSSFNTETYAVDNTLMPAATLGDNDIGVLEFEGWRIVDRDWWVNTAGGQQRENFVSASGSIMVADPDEWDDFPFESGTLSPQEYGRFDSTFRISGIDLQGIAANTARLTFFSSWRDEFDDDSSSPDPNGRTGGPLYVPNNQTASLKVIYNDPGSTELDVFTWDSDPDSPNFKDDAVNEFVNVPLLNPVGATSATLEFRLSNAANDWWWAIDKINMFDGNSPSLDGALRLMIDRDTKDVKIVNNTGATVDLRAYSIESANGALDESIANFLSLGSTDPNASNFCNCDPNSWIVLNNPASRELSEGHLDNDPNSYYTLAAGAEIKFGNAWRQFYQDFSDISFQYSIQGVSGPQEGIVEFTGNLDPNTGDPISFDQLDLDFDGDIDFADYQEFLDDYGSVPSLDGLLLAERHELGDLDQDGKYSVQDFLEFQRQFEAKFGFGSFQALLNSVPEPSAALLAMLGGVVAFGSRRNRASRNVLTLLVLLTSVTLFTNRAEAQLILYSEDFETATLNPSVEEDPNRPNAFTKTFSDPNGLGAWTIDNSAMPYVSDPNSGNGVVEYEGWSFVSKSFWLETADQDRSQFSRSTGNLLVADSDEWDDDDPEGTHPNLYDTTILSPVIPIPAAIQGIPKAALAGRLRVAFDSSWRDEADGGATPSNQTGTFGVKYNGGTTTNLLTYESDPEGDFFKDDTPNEGVELDAQFDGTASSIQLEFYYGEAWNDWWWAVDNIRLFVPANESKIQVNVGTGQVNLVGGDLISVDINSIDIQSANGNLLASPDPNNTGLSSFQPDSIDGADPDSTVCNNITECWQLGAANENYFSEFFLEGSSTFTTSRNESLGTIFDTSTDPNARDLVFTYTDVFGSEFSGIVEYVGTPPAPSDADFNNSGLVEGLDFLNWQANVGLGGQTDNSNGDANGDGTVGSADLAIWESQYGTAPLGAAVSAVPEPGTVSLLALGCLALGSRRRNRKAMVQLNSTKTTDGVKRGSMTKLIAVAVASLFLLGNTAIAVVPAPTLDRDYNFGEDDTTSTTPGSAVSFTRDGEGLPGMQQIINLEPEFGGLGPRYQEVVNRPDGGTGTGIMLNGLDDPFTAGQQFYNFRQYLKTFGNLTNGNNLALNLPVRSPSSTQSDNIPAGSIDYRFITDRGFQLWAQPLHAPDGAEDAYIVMDTNNHGVFIQNDGTFAMRYNNNDYTGVTQIDPNGLTGDPNTATWYHLSVVRAFGPGSGSILYVNGVAEAAATGTYKGETDLTAEDPNLVVDLDDSPLVIGANTNELPGQVGQNNFYSGMVDDLEMFVMGLNDSNDGPSGNGDFGEYVFERDNDYAAFFKPSVEGDITGIGGTPDGIVDMLDVTEFASNWLFENRLEWTQGSEERSLVVGDLSTRLMGDFDFSGRIDLADWEILNDQSPCLGRCRDGVNQCRARTWHFVASWSFVWPLLLPDATGERSDCGIFACPVFHCAHGPAKCAMDSGVKPTKDVENSINERDLLSPTRSCHLDDPHKAWSTPSCEVTLAVFLNNGLSVAPRHSPW